ncbi:hypothetical protein LMG26857_03562 [Achromobacter anxifer]|uniref:hypothetical protein n=1 Tax=Achromobacter anxifer TaxID=1287737 RepID=UPI00155BFAD1|nr:hypothetical protein [Achromobacter anxifer]CAB5514503.1 hypothetical protein LMG26857_03562 [Achromobacter anxifer]
MNRQEVISIAHAVGWPIGENSELVESIQRLCLEAQTRERERIASDCEIAAIRFEQQASSTPSTGTHAAEAQALRAFAARLRAAEPAIEPPTKEAEFDDCAKSPTGKHCEKWFANNNCTHCGTGECGSEVMWIEIQP